MYVSFMLPHLEYTCQDRNPYKVGDEDTFIGWGTTGATRTGAPMKFPQLKVRACPHTDMCILYTPPLHAHEQYTDGTEFQN